MSNTQAGERGNCLNTSIISELTWNLKRGTPQDVYDKNDVYENHSKWGIISFS